MPGAEEHVSGSDIFADLNDILARGDGAQDLDGAFVGGLGALYHYYGVGVLGENSAGVGDSGLSDVQGRVRTDPGGDVGDDLQQGGQGLSEAPNVSRARTEKPSMVDLGNAGRSSGERISSAITRPRADVVGMVSRSVMAEMWGRRSSNAWDGERTLKNSGIFSPSAGFGLQSLAYFDALAGEAEVERVDGVRAVGAGSGPDHGVGYGYSAGGTAHFQAP